MQEIYQAAQPFLFIGEVWSHDRTLRENLNKPLTIRLIIKLVSNYYLLRVLRH